MHFFENSLYTSSSKSTDSRFVISHIYLGTEILNSCPRTVCMGEKRSNHTVSNVNYHFVWCPKYRHTILEPIGDSLEASFRDVCDEYDYEILSLHISPDHVHLFVSAHPKWFDRPEIFRHHGNLRFANDTHRGRLYGQSRASRRGRCGNSTSRTWRSICVVVGSGNNRTTSERRVRYTARRLNSISNVQNTFECRLHLGVKPRGTRLAYL